VSKHWSRATTPYPKFAGLCNYFYWHGGKDTLLVSEDPMLALACAAMGHKTHTHIPITHVLLDAHCRWFLEDSATSVASTADELRKALEVTTTLLDLEFKNFFPKHSYYEKVTLITSYALNFTRYPEGIVSAPASKPLDALKMENLGAYSFLLQQDQRNFHRYNPLPHKNLSTEEACLGFRCTVRRMKRQEGTLGHGHDGLFATKDLDADFVFGTVRGFWFPREVQRESIMWNPVNVFTKDPPRPFLEFEHPASCLKQLMFIGNKSCVLSNVNDCTNLSVDNKPNVAFEAVENKGEYTMGVQLRALCAIKDGEQLLADYGFAGTSWWTRQFEQTVVPAEDDEDEARTDSADDDDIDVIEPKPTPLPRRRKAKRAAARKAKKKKGKPRSGRGGRRHSGRGRGGPRR
jgi:hypothetical protein